MTTPPLDDEPQTLEELRLALGASAAALNDEQLGALLSFIAASGSVDDALDIVEVLDELHRAA